MKVLVPLEENKLIEYFSNFLGIGIMIVNKLSA